MYITANSTATVDAVADAGGSQLPASKQDRLLRTAERMVRFLAPPPTTSDLAYTQAASDTEVAVFAYLVTTDEGKTSSEGVAGISTSFRSYVEFVRPIVEDGMADWYASPKKSGSAGANVAYFGDFPF